MKARKEKLPMNKEDLISEVAKVVATKKEPKPWLIQSLGR